MKLLHFIHKNLHFSRGYQKYLENQQYGKDYNLNLYFFFFSPFWLVNNKMYVQYFIMMFSYMALMNVTLELYGNSPSGISFYLNFFTIMHVFFALCSNKLYQIHLNNKLHQSNYDIDKFMKVVESRHILVQALINILLPLLCILVFGLLNYALNFFKVLLS